MKIKTAYKLYKNNVDVVRHHYRISKMQFGGNIVSDVVLLYSDKQEDIESMRMWLLNNIEKVTKTLAEHKGSKGYK